MGETSRLGPVHVLPNHGPSHRSATGKHKRMHYIELSMTLSSKFCLFPPFPLTQAPKNMQAVAQEFKISTNINTVCIYLLTFLILTWGLGIIERLVRVGQM